MSGCATSGGRSGEPVGGLEGGWEDHAGCILGDDRGGEAGCRAQRPLAGRLDRDTAFASSDALAGASADALTTGAARTVCAEAKPPADAGVSAPAAPPATSAAVRKSMQGNKRANTKPELAMRSRLRQAGLSGYRLQWKAPGRPDIAWPGKKVALFVNGCFWHRCPHCNPPMPKAHVEYWAVKFDRNQERDARNLRALAEAGWRVHVVWECQLKKGAIDATLAELLPVLASELEKELNSSALPAGAQTLA